jgi:hypothetical protein
MYAHRTAHTPRSRASAQRASSPPAVDRLTQLQQTAGNRAVTALIQRDAADDAETARKAVQQANFMATIAFGAWSKAAADLNGMSDADLAGTIASLSHPVLIRLDATARKDAPTWSGRVTTVIAAHDGEADRVGKLTADYETAVADRDWESAATALNGFSEHDILEKAEKLSAFDRMMLRTRAGLKYGINDRLPRLLAAVSGDSESFKADEIVGGNAFTTKGSYHYQLSPDAMVIDVGMNFHPDDGVTVPTSTWFGYITSTWNRFSAVNDADPLDRKHIDFNPIAGSGHDIQVSQFNAGNATTPASRADSGHYYAGDPRIADAAPHEFGHLIGLEDEYERDPADYQRVTGNAPTIGATKAAPAGAHVPAAIIAIEIRNSLFIEEKFFQWHKTAERNRMSAVDNVLAANNITADYHRGENPLTASIAAEYKKLYGHDMVDDVRSQVDSNGDDFRDWRERVLGSFESTSDSIMGDMSDHTHPVAPRHVKKFVDYLAKALNRGTWTPKEIR